jgi:phosphoglycolate phosphatase
MDASMAQIPFNIVGFDLDGTLVDSSKDLAAAVNHALASAGLPSHSVEEIKGFVGKGTRVMLERALRADDRYSLELLDELTPILMEYYDNNLCHHTQVYPGALAAMNTLMDQGVKLAVCTNKFERFTLPLLKQLQLESYFSAVVCGDSVGKAKPHAEPLTAMVERAGGGRCVFLGDTSNDIDGARNAGLASIAVSFGFVDVTETLGADAVLHHFDDLLPMLEKWHHDIGR